jgi:hypothetical protein
MAGQRSNRWMVGESVGDAGVPGGVGVPAAGEHRGGCVMRIVELSNHPRTMLQAASRPRLAGEERARAQYEDAVA